MKCRSAGAPQWAVTLLKLSCRGLLSTLPPPAPPARDVVVQRMQLEEYRQWSAAATARHVWGQEGLRGVYKGFGVTALRPAPRPPGFEEGGGR